MTGNQASPARPGLPAAQAATARPLGPAGHHAAGRRPADLPLAAAAKRTARYAPLLAGGAAAVVLAMAAAPAMASTTGGQDAATAVSIAKILKNGRGAALGPATNDPLALRVPAARAGTVSAIEQGSPVNSRRPDIAAERGA